MTAKNPDDRRLAMTEIVQPSAAAAGPGSLDQIPATGIHTQETIAPHRLTASDETRAVSFASLPVPFGRYRVEKRLGQGAMGAVYLAHDVQLDRQVALKVPHLTAQDSADIVDRLLREAKAAAKLSHPNICRVYDAGTESGMVFIAMEFIDGRVLSEFIDPDHLPDERKCANVVRKLAAALADAHALGIIHRDIKPANVMVNARGDPVLTDFGLARLADQRRTTPAPTQPGTLIGSPAYMSPEQASGDPAKVGPTSDIYSLGVLFFELLTGRLPFRGRCSRSCHRLRPAKRRRRRRCGRSLTNGWMRSVDG